MFTIPKPASRHLMALIAAGGLLLTAIPAAADGCGCETRCVSCPRVSGCQCSCSCSLGLKHNCVSKAFKAFKSKVDGLLDFGKSKRGCDACCDDACDAAMIEELMLPLPPAVDHQRQQAPPATLHSAPMPPPYNTSPSDQVPVVPPHATPLPVDDIPAPPADAAPTDDMPILPDSAAIDDMPLMPLGSGWQGQDPTVGSNILPEPPQEVPPAIRPPETDDPFQIDESQDGSIFDSLSNPFDDEARVRTRSPVRLSNYTTPTRYSTTDKRPLSRSRHMSSRRVARSAR